MIRSHLLELFTAQAWNLHVPVWNRIASMLDAHAAGRSEKEAWRRDSILSLMLEDDDEKSQPIPEETHDTTDGGVAVISVRGVLAMHSDQINGSSQPTGRSYDSIQEQILSASIDPYIRSIVLRLETPGGSACGCQETYDAILCASAMKPVHAFIDGYCYSAGYYLAAACNTITASSRSAELGSIGTIMSLWDTSERDKKEGYRKVVVRAGEFKAPAQPGEEITEASRAELQRTVDAYGSAFHDAVRAGRGLTDEQGSAVLNGRVFMASESIALGLIDQIASFTQFIAGISAGEVPMIFGKKTPPATSPPAASAATTPAATAAKEGQEMLTIPALAALIAADPTHAILISDLAKAGQDEPSIVRAVAEAKNKAATEAAAKRLEEMTSKLAAAEKALSDEKAAHAATADSLAKIKAHATTHQDPGNGGSVRTVTRAEFAKDQTNLAPLVASRQVTVVD
jgi:signal peptide peptidase SppA